MKRILLSIFLVIFTTFQSFSQISSIVEEFDLPAEVNESSGIIYFNDNIITHNDSGGENKLYEIDITTENVIRTVTISNATNVDWEDITQDDTSIYIADIGNNYGSRTNLVIYKISKSDYLSSTSVTAESIEISYADQTDFTPNLNNNEWDAEAITSYGSDLLIFNKNWVNGITKAYVVPKNAGIYSVSPMTTTLNANGRISGGTYNTISGKLYLVGYSTSFQTFIWDCENFSANDIFSGTNTQTTLSSIGLEQTEAITYVDENEYYLSSESIPAASINAKLISFDTNDVSLSITENVLADDILVYPNPSRNIVNIDEKVISIELFDTKFSKIDRKFDENQLDISDLSRGVYFLKLRLENGKSVLKKIVKI